MNRLMICVVTLMLVALPLITQANLLQNTGFEQGTGSDVIDNWTRSGDVHRETWANMTGSNGLAMYGWTTTGYAYQDVSAAGASNYTFNIYGNREDNFESAYTIELKLEFLASDYATLKAVTNDVSGATSVWEVLSIEGMSPPGTAYVRPVLSYYGPGGGGGAFKWDDAELTSTVATTTGNLLLSPGFEDGQNWNLVDDMHYEGWAAQAGTNGLAMYGWTDGGFAAQDLAYSGSSNYTFTVYGAKDAGFDLGALGVQLKLEFFSDLAGTTLIGSMTNRITSAGTAWTEYSVTAASPAGTVLVRPVIAFGGTASAGGFKWDDAVLVSSPNVSTIRYVAPSGSAIPPYDSWETAANTIQAAVNVCSSGDVVRVTNGTYLVEQAVELGVGITLESVAGAATAIIDAGGSNRCVRMYPDSVLNGFTLVNGVVSSEVANCFGGGVYCDGATIRQCNIISNTCTTVDSNSFGGGVYCRDGALVEECLVAYNRATIGSCFGGGIYCENDDRVRDCEVRDNRAMASTVFMYYGASANGGGICLAGNGTVEDSTISGNRAHGAYGYYGASPGNGGGIYCKGTGTVEDCSVVSNQITGGQGGRYGGASPRGAGIYAGIKSVVSRCTVNGNYGVGGDGGSGAGDCIGGGIYANDSQVFNCEVADNEIIGGTGGTSGGEGRGGGIYATYGARLRNVTVVNNRAIHGYTAQASMNASWGGGVFLYNDSAMHNCILYFNSATSGPNITVDGTGYYYTYCCIGNQMGGTGNISNNPEFVDVAMGDYRLTEQSPCADAGDNLSVSGVVDRVGHARIKRGVVDLGAYEAGEYIFVAKTGQSIQPYTNWLVAASNIADAVGVAEDGDYIWVSNGTYRVYAPIWIGKPLTLRSVNGDEVTTVDGGDGSRCFSFNDPNIIFDGFTVANGSVGEDNGSSRGGGIFSSLGGQIINCSFVNNRASGGYSYGGGLYVSRDGVITNCSFIENQAAGGITMTYYGRSAYGGGLYAGADTYIADCLFVSNQAAGRSGYHGSGGAYGGGLFALSNSLVVRCEGYHNLALGGDAGGRSSGAGGLGGGLSLVASTAEDCRFSRNTAQGGYSGSGGWGQGGIGYGGGVYSSGGLMTRCLISENLALGGGASGYDGGGAGCGGGYYGSYDAVLRNGMVYDNTAEGGAFTGVDIYKGGSAYGGGVYSKSGTVENCTVAYNASLPGVGYDGSTNGTDAAGGVYSFTPVLNCIVYYNQATNSPNALLGSSGGFTNCCVTPDPGGSGNVTAEPAFADQAERDLHLVYGSPCIDAGLDLSALFTDDYEGATRPIDGDMNSVALYDIGAYEYDPANCDSDGDTLTDYSEVMVHYCSPTNSDTDADGMLDGAEVVAGTSPTNEASVFVMDQGVAEDYSGSGFVVRWSSVSGRMYELVRSTNLMEGFSVLEPAISATPPMNCYTDTTATVEGTYYYKVRVLP